MKIITTSLARLNFGAKSYRDIPMELSLAPIFLSDCFNLPQVEKSYVFQENFRQFHPG